MPGPRGAGILPAACNSQVSREDFRFQNATRGLPADLSVEVEIFAKQSLTLRRVCA